MSPKSYTLPGMSSSQTKLFLIDRSCRHLKPSIRHQCWKKNERIAHRDRPYQSGPRRDEAGSVGQKTGRGYQRARRGRESARPCVQQTQGTYKRSQQKFLDRELLAYVYPEHYLLQSLKKENPHIRSDVSIPL